MLATRPRVETMTTDQLPQTLLAESSLVADIGVHLIGKCCPTGTLRAVYISRRRRRRRGVGTPVCETVERCRWIVDGERCRERPAISRGSEQSRQASHSGRQDRPSQLDCVQHVAAGRTVGLQRAVFGHDTLSHLHQNAAVSKFNARRHTKATGMTAPCVVSILV